MPTLSWCSGVLIRGRWMPEPMNGSGKMRDRIARTTRSMWLLLLVLSLCLPVLRQRPNAPGSVIL